MKHLEESIDINGQKFTLQVGKLARAADVSVLSRIGDTCVLVTLTTAPAKEDIDYLPLQVEYVEKLYAGGRIKGSRWVKREGRPTDEAVLIARLVDRGIRPLFPKSYRRAIQIVMTLLSVDGVNSPDIVAANGAYAAVHLSSLPCTGPLSITRVGYVQNDGKEGTYEINPDDEILQFSKLDLLVTSLNDKVVMIETQAEEVPEEAILNGIKAAKDQNAKIASFVDSFRAKVGLEKEKFVDQPVDEKLAKIIKTEFKKDLDALIAQFASKEFADKNAVNAFVDSVIARYPEEYDKKTVAKTIDYVSLKTIKENVLKTRKRVDGRDADTIRDIDIQLSLLPRTHGSAVFKRGDTQVLSIATLGAPSLHQLIENPEGEESKTYIHHYYMPPYSVGEVGRVGFSSRREIGHGALAEKAIEPILPTQKDFPYTIRVVSEVLSSNGSTSMASTCGSSLALMDAGVPTKEAVSGIAMGLYGDPDSDHMILTDIMGIEDFSGDMDFKVTGSKNGITAIQLDVKNKGLSDEFIEETLKRAKKARLFILDKMVAAISGPRKELSQFAPKVVVLTPPQDKIGEIIGPGGKNIRGLIARTETDIDVSPEGVVTISGIDKDKVELAAKQIENQIREIQEGEIFEGEVVRILPFGAFVELLPGKDGMVHVSKMGKGFVKHPEDVVKIGQKVKVRVYQIDAQNRVNLELLS